MCGIRSVKHLWFYLLALPICGILAAIIGFNWTNWSAPEDGAELGERVVSSEIAETRDENEAKAYQDRIAELERLLADAQARVHELESRSAQDWESTVEIVDSVSSQNDNGDTVALLSLERAFKLIKENDPDDEYELFYPAAVLLFGGKKAAERLVRDARNPQLDIDYRRRLLEGVSMAPYPACLDLLLNPPADLAAMQDRPEVDKCQELALMVRRMATSDVAPHIAHVRRIAETEIRNPREGYDQSRAWSVAAALAFKHDDATAMRLFTDIGLRKTAPTFQIAALKGIHTPESRRIAEQIAATDLRPEIREAAKRTLADW